MASFLFFIFTVLLLPVAQSEECFECFTDGGGYCSGTKRNCTDQGKCLGVSTVANLSIVNRLTSSFARTCVAPANFFQGSFYFDFGDDRILDIHSRGCNATDPQCSFGSVGDSMRIYENGKSCPKCYRTGHDNCDTDGDVQCLGDLVNCTELNGEITSIFSSAKIPFAGKGCVSRSVCDLKGKSFRQGGYTVLFNDLTCSEANGALSSLRRLAFTLEKKDLGPQVAFFFPCILGIFAVKILS